MFCHGLNKLLHHSISHYQTIIQIIRVQMSIIKKILEDLILFKEVIPSLLLEEEQPKDRWYKTFSL